MHRPALALLVCLTLATGALAAAMSVKEEMKGIVEPGANMIFAVGGDVDPANGPDAAKVPDARWGEALKAAKALKAVSADLKGVQKMPGDEWTKAAADFARLAADAEAAAMKKDGAGLSKAANDLGDTCTACHSRYKKQG